MPSSPSRGPVTTRLLDELGTLGFPVGDNAAPTQPHGWQGEPNAADATFIPYNVLTPAPGLPQAPPGGMADTGTEWRLSYNIFYAGLSRKQVEALADRMRNQMCNITREDVDSETGKWRIQKISCATIGSSNRVGSTYPDYHTQSDSYEVWITKGRS